MNGKYAFAREMPVADAAAFAAELKRELAAHADTLRGLGLLSVRMYTETLDGQTYGFQFVAAEPSADSERLFGWVREHTGVLSGWEEARHVYEFKLHPGDSYDHLQTQGIVIGVREGKLDEYIRLHDTQPQIIHDLCYQNGFRKSSIFVTELHKPYLLQFQEFSGKENPELYQDPTYLNWLKVTGECQEPLPGQKFWKPMQMQWSYQ